MKLVELIGNIVNHANGTSRIGLAALAFIFGILLLLVVTIILKRPL